MSESTGGASARAAAVLVFDLDGVIIRSTLPKHRAMLSLFPSSVHGALSETLLRLGGVPRREKLGLAFRMSHGRQPTEAELAELLRCYAHRLEQVLAQPESMPGLACFVRRAAGPKFVCSAAPAAEVQAQLARLDLLPYFQRVYASQSDKVIALRDIQLQRPELRVLFFGDALQDLAAAKAAGVGFVAVVGERDAFPGQAIPKLQDFSDELLVERCMLEALRRVRA
ncbi:MAG: HAD family hydrolase [Roseateles sp.]